jgi:hypothetical protein
MPDYIPFGAIAGQRPVSPPIVEADAVSRDDRAAVTRGAGVLQGQHVSGSVGGATPLDTSSVELPFSFDLPVPTSDTP